MKLGEDRKLGQTEKQKKLFLKRYRFAFSFLLCDSVTGGELTMLTNMTRFWVDLAWGRQRDDFYCGLNNWDRTY